MMTQIHIRGKGDPTIDTLVKLSSYRGSWLSDSGYNYWFLTTLFSNKSALDQ